MGQQVKFALSQSMHRVVITLLQFLPGLVAFLLALVVFIGLGALLAAVLRRILGSLRFDERLAARQSAGSPTNVADWSPSHSPTQLIARTTFWASVLLGVGVGVTAFDASYAAGSQVSLFLLPYFTHVTGAVLLLLAGGLLGRFLARSVLISAVNAQLQYARILSLGVKWLVYVLAATMALDHLRIGGTIVELAFGILFGGIVLTLSLAVGLGSQDLVSRSITKTMEKPGGLGPTTVPMPGQPDSQPSKLRHF